MTMIAICAAAGSAAVLLPVSVTAQQQGMQVSEFRLANGLDVVVIPDRRTPVVTHMLWYRIGSADSPPGKSGLAHFLEHLMFKGTEKNPAGRFSQVVATIGGQENAFTSQDYTAYFQRVTKENLEQVMTFEADRMTGLVLTDEVVDPERLVILEERRSRTDNEPQAQLGEMVNAALYLNHPYRLPVIGWKHEMEGLTTEDAIDFYRRWYRPNNAILVLEGDITVEEVRPMVEKYYGAVPAGEAIERNRLEEPPRTARTASPSTSATRTAICWSS